MLIFLMVGAVFIHFSKYLDRAFLLSTLCFID